jgi:hypothetical protein
MKLKLLVAASGSRQHHNHALLHKIQTGAKNPQFGGK